MADNVLKNITNEQFKDYLARGIKRVTRYYKRHKSGHYIKKHLSECGIDIKDVSCYKYGRYTIVPVTLIFTHGTTKCSSQAVGTAIRSLIDQDNIDIGARIGLTRSLRDAIFNYVEEFVLDPKI